MRTFICALVFILTISNSAFAGKKDRKPASFRTCKEVAAATVKAQLPNSCQHFPFTKETQKSPNDFSFEIDCDHGWSVGFYVKTHNPSDGNLCIVKSITLVE